MTTSKGTIQGYNGVVAADKKYQIIIDAQAFGKGQEHHTLTPVLTSIKHRFANIGISKDIYKEGVIVTASAGFANDDNYQYMRDEQIDAYIPDNQFRSRDKNFAGQKEKHGKRGQENVKGIKSVIPLLNFILIKNISFVFVLRVTRCGLKMKLLKTTASIGYFFEGKLTDCRQCPIKNYCMRNLGSVNYREGHGRQVSITYTNGRAATDWMKKRIDSRYCKVVYGHRMSTVEPVFANICINKGLNCFSLRGKHKVQGQWQLFCLVHNIDKLMNYGQVA